MIVLTGALRLLDAQLPYLQTLVLGLFVNDLDDNDANALGDYEEASFDGYARLPLPSWTAPLIVAGRAQSQPASVPTWTNLGTADATVFGALLIDPADDTLVDATNFGAKSIPAGLQFGLPAASSVTQEGL